MLQPGQVLGVLGGGQLGRMLALAAAPLGLRCHIYCPDPQSPAFDVAADRTLAPYDDGDALDRFAGNASPVHDADAVDSPAPPPGVFATP